MVKALLRYPGGKGRLAKRIIARFPKHEVYLEPCCGGASVLLNKPRARHEFLSDTDPTIIKMLRGLRDHPAAVLELCANFEYSQEWLDKCKSGLDRHTQLNDALVAACKIFLHHATRSGSGKGKLATWKYHSVAWYTPVASWVNKRKTLPVFAARLEGVIIEELDCFTALRRHLVGPHAGHSGVTYVDPPYDGSAQHGSLDHVELARVLHETPGARFITHYQCDEYDTYYVDWCRDDFRLGNQYSGQGASGNTKLTTESLYWCLT